MKVESEQNKNGIIDHNMDKWSNISLKRVGEGQFKDSIQKWTV